MPIIKLTDTALILTDFFAWFVLHVVISLALLRVPLSFFEKENRLFYSYSWEKKGAFWQTYFHVRSWKGNLPDGASLFRLGFKKKYLTEVSDSYLNRFILESKRAELNHWLLLLPAPFFFLWNPSLVGWLNILYALVANSPFIIIQRYNRPRFEKIQQKKKRRIKKIKEQEKLND